MKYTTSKLADKKIEEDLEIIKKIIIEEINPVSIILIGGFARGEGSFMIKDSKIVPLNDYDLYVVTERKFDDEFLDEISLKCSKAIGRGGLEFVEHSVERYDVDKFFHVDIRCLLLKNLRKLLPTQRTFELKRSMIVYGKDVLDEILDVKVPVSDAIRLLFNKMDHLLLSKDNTKEIKLIYSIKAFLDCCSALLIFNNKFEAGYKKRNEIFQKLDFPKKLKEKVNWATEMKLKPVDFDVNNVDGLWEEARYWVGYTFKFILATHLDLESSNWKNLAKVVYGRLPYHYFSPYLPNKNLFFLQYYLTLKWCLKTKEFKSLLSWRDVGLKVAIPLFLYLYDEKEDARRYLSKLTNNTEPLKERILELYASYYLQRLI